MKNTEGLEIEYKSVECAVLGTPYIVKLGKRDHIGIDEANMGECRTYAKEIMVCTEDEKCTEAELRVRTQEVLAHEFFHAYLNEAGVSLDEETEEKICYFFMKNWRKMNNAILKVLDEYGMLDK